MPSVKDEFERLKWLMNQGKQNERVTPAVLVKEAAANRVKNDGPKPKTRFIFDTGSPHAYSLLNKYKDLVLEICVNKSIGVDMLIRAWDELLFDDAAKLKAWLSEAE